VASVHDNKTGNVTLQAAALSYFTPSNNPPVVWIDSPADNSNVAVTTNVSISAVALDTDGSVTNVEFFQGTNKWARRA
jgi:hypothetical protein